MLTLASRAAYDLWSETYPAEAHNPLMVAEEAAVARQLATIRATCALDVGTGSGRYVPRLEATGARTVVGADLSLGMLRRNRSRHRICADTLHLPLPSSRFDLVNASLIAGDIANLSMWIEELARVLMLGGHLVYSDFHTSWDRHGWKRTFRTSDGTECVLPRVSHQRDDHFSAIERAGLDMISADEVTLPMGRDMLMPWRRRAVPTAMVFHARKGRA